MSLSLWVAQYLAHLVFVVWVVRLGGAGWLSESFLGLLFLPALGGAWSPEGVRIFVVSEFVLATIWFGAGLVWPGARLMSL